MQPTLVCGGDFNVIRFPNERLEGSSSNVGIRGFDTFIRECGLKYLPLSNAQYTWSIFKGRIISSRLNRFFITPG